MNTLDRRQLIELVARIMAAQGESQEEADDLIALFEANVPHPRASDLIFFPLDEFGYEPSPTEIVDRALGYKPISGGE